MTKGPVSGALVSACYKEREHGLPAYNLEIAPFEHLGKGRLRKVNLKMEICHCMKKSYKAA